MDDSGGDFERGGGCVLLDGGYVAGVTLSFAVSSAVNLKLP